MMNRVYRLKWYKTCETLILIKINYVFRNIIGVQPQYLQPSDYFSFLITIKQIQIKSNSFDNYYGIIFNYHHLEAKWYNSIWFTRLDTRTTSSTATQFPGTISTKYFVSIEQTFSDAQSPPQSKGDLYWFLTIPGNAYILGSGDFRTSSFENKTKIKSRIILTFMQILRPMSRC